MVLYKCFCFGFCILAFLSAHTNYFNAKKWIIKWIAISIMLGCISIFIPWKLESLHRAGFGAPLSVENNTRGTIGLLGNSLMIFIVGLIYGGIARFLTKRQAFKKHSKNETASSFLTKSIGILLSIIAASIFAIILRSRSITASELMREELNKLDAIDQPNNKNK